MSKELTFPGTSQELVSLAPPTVEQALSEDIIGQAILGQERQVALARDLAKSMVPGMTEYQIVEFIAGDVVDRVTPYGIYHQVLRELGSRYASLLDSQYTYEKDQARLLLLSAKKRQQGEQLAQAELDSWAWDKAIAKIAKLDAEISHILRGIPILEIQVKDTVRQIAVYVQLWDDVKDQVDLSLPDVDMQRIEWEAKVLIRYFKGKLSHIPTQFDHAFLNSALDLAMTMREYGFSNEQAIEVGSTCSVTWRVKINEIIERESLRPADFVLPINNQDEIPGFIAQRRRAQKERDAILEQQLGANKKPGLPMKR